MRNLYEFFKYAVLCMLITPYWSSAQDRSIYDQTRDDFMIVTLAGVSGAVLGLSTLSFTTSPKKHSRNILTGAAIGLVAGVIYVAYRQATDVDNLPLKESNSYFDRETYDKEILGKLSVDRHHSTFRVGGVDTAMQTSALAAGIEFQF